LGQSGRSPPLAVFLGATLLFLVGIFLSLTVFTGQDSFAQTDTAVKIPDWVKGVANFWSTGQITDQEFVDALEFLIKEKVIHSSSITVLDQAPEDSRESTPVTVPSWIKEDAGSWYEGAIGDSEFAERIEFMIEQEIIRSPKIKMSDEDILDDLTSEDYNQLIQISNKILQDLDETTFKQLTADERIAQVSDPTIDSDGDGIPDEMEIRGWFGFKTDPNKADTDEDGLTDLREFWWNTNPTNADTDGDFRMDGPSIDSEDISERRFPYASSVEELNELGLDDDGDGIPDAAEEFDVGTDPQKPSTDGDRYDDGLEFFGISTKHQLLPQGVPPDPFVPAAPDIVIRVNPDVKFLLGTTITHSDLSEEIIAHEMSHSKEKNQSLWYSVTARLTFGVEGCSNPTNCKGAYFNEEIELEAGVREDFTFSSKQEERQLFVDTVVEKKDTVWGETTTLRMSFIIENVGNDFLKDCLTDIMFNIYLGNDKTSTIPTVSLIKEGDYEIDAFCNLEPGATRQITIIDIPMNLENTKRFLAGEGVRVEVANLSFGEDQRYLSNAQKSTLQIVLDDGDKVEKQFLYLPNVMNFKEVLQHANISHDLTSEGQPISIGEMEFEREKLPFKSISVYYSPPTNPDKEPQLTTIDKLEFENGGLLVIKQGFDSDCDYLSDEDELRIGTDPKNPDTDGDLLWDGLSYPDDIFPDECFPNDSFDSFPDEGIIGELDSKCPKDPNRTTNPLMVDTDLDGFNDYEEVVLGIPDEEADPCEKVKIETGWSDWGRWFEGEVPNIGLISDIAVGKIPDGRLEVFATGTDNALWHTWQTTPNGPWEDWGELNAWLTNIEVGQNLDGRLEVFGLHPNDRNLYHLYNQDSGGWSNSSPLEEGHSWNGIAVGRNLDGRLDVFTIGDNRKLYHIWQKDPNSDEWSNFDDEGGDIKKNTDIEVGKNADGRLEVFIIHEDNELRHIWQEEANKDWKKGWDNLKGSSLTDIAVGKNSDRRLQVFAIDTVGILKHCVQARGSEMLPRTCLRTLSI